MAKNTSRELAKQIAKIASDHKAMDIVVMDLRKIVSFTDYFVICSGGSERHVQAIADHVAFEEKQAGHRTIGEEGYTSGRWVLLDYGDVVVHVFYGEEREHYGLEKLWHDASIVKIKGVTEAA